MLAMAILPSRGKKVGIEVEIAYQINPGPSLNINTLFELLPSTIVFYTLDIYSLAHL